jgi:hypothetical protein
MTRLLWLLALPVALLFGCPSDDDDDAADDDTTAGDDDDTTNGDDDTSGDDDTTAGDDDDDTGAVPSYAADVDPIFQGACGPCHIASDSAGLSLDPGYAEIVDVPANQLPTMDRVEPGDFQASYLLHKLLGTQDAEGGSGGQMPANAPPLNSTDMDIIQAWIDEGAAP